MKALNTSARDWRAAPLQPSPRDFHRGVTGYEPTPLRELPAFASELGIRRLFVKDESSRLGLPAFKVLGASYAIARTLSQRLGHEEALSLDRLRSALEGSAAPRLVAATDGNHGRAVARVAAMLGVSAEIHVPQEVSDASKRAIVDEGASLIEHGIPYDDVVALVARQLQPQDVLIQDTAWHDYETVSGWIVDGYTTLLEEIDEQLEESRLDAVVVPAGVGSLAQAVVAHYRSTSRTPAVVIVEPETAATITRSLQRGSPVAVPTGDTVMTGLNCGTVSSLAWSVLQHGADLAITVTDEEALAAVRDLERAMDAGPCGAATLAGIRSVMADEQLRSSLHLDADAVVVLLSTESYAANPKGGDHGDQ
ncbi:diaminopropionate ammonia-lyase [uncultured Agrococcus sp.]|uniref:diaminopropionate ammonia-lyase n=1 Tax=uncultured Agrococcus sp. TaxID=382258 RepID=UPI0025D7DD50|nr:diaminopropionate ammonia-lyase [uncultured Agrococcus sp.]